MSYSDILKKHGLAPKSDEEENTKSNTKKSSDVAAIQNKHGISYEVDEKYLNTFISDANSFFGRLNDGTASYNYATIKLGDLSARYDEIRGWLYQNKSRLDEESYNSLAGLEGSFSALKKHYSQWENQKEYDDAIAAQKDYEEKKNLDIDAAEQEIRDYEAAYKAYQLRDDYDYYTEEERQAAIDRYMAHFEKYGVDPNAYTHHRDRDLALAEAINGRRAYIQQAKRLQEGIRLASVTGNDDFKANSGYVSTEVDSVWDKLWSEYGMGYGDMTYEYINGDEEFRSKVRRKHEVYASGHGDSKYEERGYDYMDENEIAIYNYYYAKDGKEAAEKYLDSIQESLNLDKATSMYSDMEGKTFQELLFGVSAGLDQFESGMKGLWNAAIGNEEYIPPSATQMASGMVREDLADDSIPLWYNFKEGQWEDKVLGNSFGQIAYDTTTTTANMLPSILTSVAVNFVAPGSGAAVGSALLGSSAAGNAYQEMINLGYDKSQARAYAALVGGSEAGLSYLLSGISSMGGKLSNNAISGLVDKVDNAFARTAIKLGGTMASEFTEEYIQEVLTPWFQNIALGMNNDINLFTSEALYSGLLGALTAGIMEGGSTVYGEVKTYKTGKQLQAADISAQRLAEIGKTFSADTVAYQLAGRVNENTGAYTMGRLFNEIGAEVTALNKADIENSLISKGVSTNNAKVIAASFADIVAGAELTSGQISMIEANDVLAQTVREVIIDQNSTANQRSQGYKQVLMDLAREKTSSNASRTNPAKQGEENAPTADIADTTKENGAEGNAEAEVDTSPAKVKSISSVQKKTIKLEDGSEVSVKDADLDPDDGIRIDTITSIDGISDEDANFVLNTLRSVTGASAQIDSLGAKEAYKYGFYGLSEDHMTKHGVFANSLTETQRKKIYETGKNARAKQIEEKTPNTVAGTSKQTGIYFDAGNGNVVPYRESNVTALDKKQSAGVRAAMVLRKLGIGGNIYFFKSYINAEGRLVYKDKNGVEKAAPNGWYEKDGSIHIDLNAGAKGNGVVLFTLAHELTHFIEQWSPKKYKILADFLVENYEKGQSMDKLVRAKQARLSELRGKPVSYPEAYSEVVADSMEAMLADGNVLEKLIELKAKDNSLFMKMKQFFENILNKIRNVYKGLTPDSAEGKAVLEMTDSIEKIQQLFAEALVDAGENYQASLTPGEEGTVVNQNGDPVAHATADGTVQLSMRTYEEEGRDAFRNYLEKCVTSKKLTKAEMQEMLEGIEDIYQTCKEFKDKYAPFSTWSDAAVVRDTYGKPVFSVVTPNGDYKMNLDFSLVCKKRRTLDAVFNEMSKRGIIDNFELGQKSVVKINEIIRKHGLETACALCFVDAKRFRQASMADSFTRLYNELVNSLVPEDQRSSIDHFNFSGYETIKKVEGGIDTWANSKLDFSHIDDVMKNYGTGTVEYKAAKYIKTHPEGRKLLLRGDFMSSKGFDAVKTQNKDILKLYNSKKGTGGPKAAFGDVQYMNEIIKKARTWTPAKAYSVGGVRIQSFSDYVPRMVFDYTQMIYDLAATKLPAHAYTKEALFVKQFGLTGVKINMSLIPAIAEGGIAPGLDANGNYVWAGESFDYETAKEIQNAEGYTENCGTICVGVSYDHIVKLLRDPNIRMVIPYHKSGLNPIVAHMNKIAEFTDYTNDQRTKGKDGKALGKDFDFSKALHDMGENASPKAVADQYLKWCAAHGYTPRFAEFAMEDNYYKLLEDFTLYDKDGNYVPQREVRAVFPKEGSAFGSMKSLIEAGLEEDAVIEGKRDASLSEIVDEIQKTLPRTEAEIAETQVEQADRDLEADAQYSARDYVKQVDEVKNNTHDPNNHVYMGTTPVGIAKVLGLPKLPMLITPQHIYSMAVSEAQAQHEGRFKSRFNYHNLGWDAVKKLPEYTNKPVLLIKSNTDPNDATFVVVTAQSDNAGNPIIAAVKPNGRGNYFNIEFPTNFMLSGYGKDGIQGYVARAKTENRILYANKNSQKNKNTTSVQFADNILSSDYTANLADFQKIVKSKFVGTVFENSGLPQFSERDTESVSNRSLLANAFEGVAKDDIERNKIREYKGKIDLIEAEERKLSELNEKIKELSFAKGPRDTAAIRDLQFEARQTANRINTYDKQLLRLEASKPLQDVLAREKKQAYQRAEQRGKEAMAAYREKAAKTQRELLERWQESRKKGVEGRHKTAMRHKIKDVVNDLNQYLLKGTKDRHVPIGLQKAVAEALNAVNMDTVGAEERIAKLNDELMKAKTPEAIREISKRIDNIREMGDRMDERLKKLRAAYDEFINSDDPMIANSHDDGMSGHMMTLIVRVGDTPLREMSLSQLQDVYDVYKIVLDTIRNANKSFKDNKNREISTRSNQVMAEIDNLGVKRGKRPVFMNWVEKFGWDNLKPVYAMEHIGSNGLIEAFENVRAGEDTWARDVTEAREYYLEQSKKYKYDSWDFEKQFKFTSTSGMEFELTLDQIMSLYAYSKRDQAADHLKYGGIVFDPKTEVVVKTKSGIKVKYNVANATSYNISEETLGDITSKLTEAQKNFVDEMQAYLSDVMGGKGNEVSLAMYGVKLFRDKFYFPLKSAHQYMAKAKEQAQGDVKIKNSGFSKETKPHAKNPIVLSSFMDVWANHVNEMSMYHAFVLPMEDFYRIYNYTTPSNNENLPTEGVNPSIENAYGSAATGYIEQMLKDLNGGARSDSTTGFINKMIGLFKKGSVFASLSVVVQQPSAIARAAALVDTKYFIGPKVDHKRHKALWEEVKQYAPVAIIKEMGYFDTNMGKSTQDFILSKEYSGFKEKMSALVKDSGYRDEVLSKAPALADELAWCSIWEAVKRETKANNPGMDVKSEEFLKKAGERFTEVITKTQVYDSVLSRSALMRSKDTGMKMATAFMAEPTTSINMIADALLKGKRGNKKYARAAIGSVIASQILNSILVSFVYAGRDDDEDETYLEKYVGTLTGEMLDSLNPAGYIPFIKDIMSIVQGYDVERSDMAVISDLWKAWENLSKDNVSTYRKVEGFAGSVAQIFGLPVKNIMRDARGIYQTIDSFVNGQQTTAAGIGYAVKGAITGKTVSDQQQLYEAYLSGDKAQIARVTERFEDQKAINSAIRKALRENDPRIKGAAEAKANGDLDEYLRLAKEIIAEKHFSQDDVVAAINAEINALDKGEETTSAPKASGMFKADDFAVAISQGDTAMANAIKTDIIQTAQKNGKTAEEAEKSFITSATSSCKAMFDAGDMTEREAINALTNFCGKTEDEAVSKVRYWEFKQDYPDTYVDDAWIDEYCEEVESSGISIEVFVDYRNQVKNITGEDKKQRRMAIIHSLPITSAQKDALYYAEGWTASKLYEAPWH